MAITYRIDKFKGIVNTVVEDTFTTKDILHTFDSFLADPDFKPAFQLLSDHRNLKKPITTEQIKFIVDYVKKHRNEFQFSRWAMVVSTPVSYGMMRMLSMLLESAFVEVRVFKDIAEASIWLVADVSRNPNAAQVGENS
jgi:SpoIIAA-like